MGGAWKTLRCICLQNKSLLGFSLFFFYCTTSHSSPEMKRFMPTGWSKCIESQKAEDSNNINFYLHCDYSKFIITAKKTSLRPSDKLVMLKIIHQNMIALSTKKIAIKSTVKPATKKQPGFLAKIINPLVKLYQTTTNQIPQQRKIASAKTKYKTVITKNLDGFDKHLDDGYYFLSQLLGSKDKSRHQGKLAYYGSLAWVNILLFAEQYPRLTKFINDNNSFFTEKRSNRKKIALLKLITNETKQSKNQELKKWLASQFGNLKVKDYGNDYFYITSQKIKLSPKKYLSTNTIHKLYWAYPEHREDLVKILLDNKYIYSVPNIDTMSWTLQNKYFRALIKNLKTEKVNNILNQLLAKDSKVSKDIMWNRLKLHMRVLRLLDQRDKIEQTLNQYLAKGRFLAGNKKSYDHFKKRYEVIRLYWNYIDNDIAYKKINQFIKDVKKINKKYLLEKAYFMLARITEQTQSPESSIKQIRLSLSEKLTYSYKLNLEWRLFYLLFEKGQKLNKFTEARAQLRHIDKKYNEPLSQINYWYGLSYLQKGEKVNAKQYFLKGYKNDPYSYYSNLCGIHLRKLKYNLTNWNFKSPSPWLASDNKTKQWKQPNWESYFSKDQVKLTSPDFAPILLAYQLQQAGEIDFAIKEIKAISKTLWKRTFSKKYFYNNRMELNRDVAWIHLAIGNTIGSLQVAEINRKAFGFESGREDFDYLYPLKYKDIVFNQAKVYEVYPWLAISLIRQESAFNPQAKSIANALGLMQVIPPVARHEAGLMNWHDFNVEDLTNPEVSVKLGMHHLSRLYKDYDKSFIAATAGYNAGRPPLINWLNQNYKESSPATIFIERISYSETRKYVKSILRNIINYKRLYDDGNIDVDKLMYIPNPEKIKVDAVVK